MIRSTFVPRLLLIIAAAWFAGCTRTGSASSEPPGPPSHPSAEATATRTDNSANAPFDVGAVIRQVHFAFRKEQNAWRGGHTTYDVLVARQGMELRAYHHPNSNGTDAERTQPEAGQGPRVPAEVVESAGLQLGRARIGRGHRLFAAENPRVESQSDGTLKLHYGAVAEALSNGDEGVEQTWTFGERPSGSGDLVVRVPVRGMEFSGRTGSGLHFTDPATGIGFRYGNGTWIDADGVRTAVPAHYHEGSIVLRLASHVVQRSAFPAVLDPIISPEFGMDQPVLLPAANEQLEPSIAFDGTQFFVAWEDGRGSTRSTIFGTRVSTAGAILDPAGIPISAGSPGSQQEASVASNGTGFFVVWSEWPVLGGPSDIEGARVSPAGVLLDPLGIVISGGAHQEMSPAVVSDGSGYLVAWTDTRNGNGNWDIYAARVDGAGAVLDPSGIPISTASTHQSEPSVAFNGSEHLIVWRDLRNGTSDIYGSQVTQAGTVVHPSGISISTAANDQIAPSVASHGSNYLVVWQDYRSGVTPGIYGTRVSSGGATLDVSGISICVAGSNQVDPSIANDGTGYFVVWQDNRSGSQDIYGARLSTSGAVVDPSGIHISSHWTIQGKPAVASDGTNYLVAWQDRRNSSTHDVYAARVNGTGAVLDGQGLLVTEGANEQFNPAVASNGTGYLVVWADLRNGNTYDIYGTRVSATGSVLDPSGIAISTAANHQSDPAVASNGTDYFVTWVDARVSSDLNIYGARVTSSSGSVLDVTGIPIAVATQAQRFPSVASDGAVYLVAWSDLRNSGAGYDVYAARVNGAGQVLEGVGFVIAGGAGDQAMPSVTNDGTDFFVVWQGTDAIGSDVDIYGARVNSAGVVLDPSGIVISPSSNEERLPSVASTGSGFLVVWFDHGSNSNPGIHGARVSTSGAVLDPAGIPIQPATGYASLPSVASNGTGYLVVWQDRRSGTHHIYGSRVTMAGTVLDPTGIALSPSVFDSGRPKAASTAGTGYLIAHEGFDFASGVNSRRVMARIFTDSLPPTAMNAVIATGEDQPVSVTLSANDPEGASLTWTILSGTSNGTLSGTAPNLIYTPNSNFHGTDTFTFKVNDGTMNSNAATVTITVSPENDVPTADPQFITMAEDAAQAIALSGADADGDPLTYVVLTQPTHGTLAGNPPNLTYTPAPNYAGPDAFTFKVADGASDSAIAMVTLEILAVNDAPVASNGSAMTDEDTATSFMLAAADIDSSTLAYVVVGQPQHGTLTGTGPTLTYTPAANYNGPDSFAFKATDGALDSNVATMALMVVATNDAPVATAQAVTTVEDTMASITLAGADIDENPLTFIVVVSPSHGTLSGTAPEITYTPDSNYSGPDQFTFQVTDGVTSSPTVPVSITVTQVNDVPVAHAQSIDLTQGETVDLTLVATDDDGDALTYKVVTQPAGGDLTGTAPALRYKAPAGFRGKMTFSFQANDGLADSNAATITLEVNNGGPTVTASAEQLMPTEGQPVKFVATAADPGGDVLTFAWDLGDGKTSNEQNPSHVFTEEGMFEVKVVVDDGLETASATLSVVVANSAPVIVPATGSAPGEEGTELKFTVDAQDPGAMDTVEIVWNWGDGSADSKGVTVSHTFADDGIYEVTVTATDDDGAFTTATRTVTVANTPPIPSQQEALTTELGKAVTVKLTAADRAGNQDPLRWSLVEGPGVIEPDGTYTWTADAKGSFVVKARVIDDDDGAAESVFSVEAIEGDEPSGGGCASAPNSPATLLPLAGVALLAALRRPRRALR